jgi:DNA-binding transcriptional ArsR family regulator
LTAYSVRENLRFVATYESVLDALGDRTRRQIVLALRDGPAAVGELAERLPVSRPAISQHLKVLQACQLVAYEPAGTRHVYRLDPAGVRELRAWLDDFWEGALGQFARYAAEQAASETAPWPSAGDPAADSAGDEA